MNRVLIILFLLLISMNVFAQEKMATWEFYNEDYKERGGRYTGPGIAYLDLINCSVKMELLSNEYIIYTYQRSGGLMLIHALGKKPKDYTMNLGLGCYAGKDLDDIKRNFTLPDGRYGLSESFRKWGEDNTAKIAVKLFDGANWKGVGNVEYLYTTDFPGRYTEFCIFSATTKTPQALCNGDAWNFPFNPKRKSDTYQYTYDIFKRITFIDHDHLPTDSPAIPPKPAEPAPAVPADSVQSE